MSTSNFDLAVIGAGPGGYIAAIRAAQLGMKTACIEKERLLGGTCLRVGCIPSKALLESTWQYANARSHLSAHGVTADNVSFDLAAAMKRKEDIVQGLASGVEALFGKNGITRFQGTGRLGAPGTVMVSGEDGETDIRAEHIIIATGSSPAALRGVEMDGAVVGTSTDALRYDTVPERLVVIGAGYIGLELGSAWARLGAEVTVLEYLPRILPGMDTELAKEARKVLEKQGLRFVLQARVTGVTRQGSGALVHIDGAEDIACDRVLVAVGRTPNTEGLGLAEAGVATDEKGRIEVDDSFATSIPGVYAIGDVIRGPMLAHKAEEEGVACVERIATGYGHVNYDAIPGVVYTHPEIASVGRTEDELKESGVEYRKGTYPFRANSRARALGETQGFVKMLADAKTDRVLGVHIIGPDAGHLIAEAAAAIEFAASSEDIARTSHAHPTLSEAVKEAALAVDGRTLNM